ncbi:hypothetical protein [Succinimonas sp.]|uniref:hypothetical protein n=1 Tax=Succinimonas sp. TaxID=1936151 RepID=UPI00386D0A7B
MKMIAPFDIALGLAGLPFKMSAAMMLDIAKRAVSVPSYEELQSLYLKDRNIEISDDQLRLVTNYIGNLVYDDDCLRRDKARDHFQNRKKYRRKKSGTLYVVTECATLNIRTENGSARKENWLGLVFSSKNIRNIQSESGQEYRKILTKEYVSLIGNAEAFGEHLYEAALRNGLEEHERIAVISDGAPGIKSFLTTYCSELDVIQILDYTHLKETVFRFAAAGISGGEETKTGWGARLMELIAAGRISEALKMAEPFRDFKREGVPNIRAYLDSNKDCIDYPAYVKDGCFIDSSAIETGNESAMRERLKLPGRRWDAQTAQYVLSAKMKYDSGLWDSYVVPLAYRHLGLRPPR